MHNASEPTPSISPIRLNRDGEVAVLELARPGKLNAIDAKTVHALSDLINRCEADPEVAAIVLCGSGRAFCAGVDLTAIAEGAMPQSVYTQWEETLWRIETLSKPVLCAIHGHCIGAGVQLALACDLRVGHANATFALPAAKEGLIPGLSTHRLWRFVGMGTARRMTLFNETLPADEALGCGLIDKVADETGDQVQTTVVDYTIRLARSYLEQLQPMSFLMCKKAFSLPRYTQTDVLDQYLANQDVCLRHPGHINAAEAWLSQARQ